MVINIKKIRTLETYIILKPVKAWNVSPAATKRLNWMLIYKNPWDNLINISKILIIQIVHYWSVFLKVNEKSGVGYWP